MLLVLVFAMAVLPGCYSKRFKTIDQTLAALGVQADSLASEHARTKAELATLKAENEQNTRSLRAGSQTSVEQVVGRIEQLESRLEDQAQQLNDLSGRTRTRAAALDTSAWVPVYPAPRPQAPAPTGRTPGATPGTTPGGTAPGAGVQVDPTAAYDQAVTDFTQGRFPLALAEFRAFVAAHGTSDLGDNAQYGIGESYYAVGQYDSAAVAYRAVVERWPQGDKVPAALYKLGIAYQKSNRSAEARATFRMLIDKYPRSGEARLAEERLREMDQR